jgi:hypothetical protein
VNEESLMDAEPPLIRWQVVDRLQLILAEGRRINLPKPRVYPSMEGGVQMEWRSPMGYDVEVEILNDGTVTLFDPHAGKMKEFDQFDAVRIAGGVAAASGTQMPSMPRRPPKEPGAVSPKPDGSR